MLARETPPSVPAWPLCSGVGHLPPEQSTHGHMASLSRQSGMRATPLGLATLPHSTAATLLAGNEAWCSTRGHQTEEAKSVLSSYPPFRASPMLTYLSAQT